MIDRVTIQSGLLIINPVNVSVVSNAKETEVGTIEKQERENPSENEHHVQSFSFLI